VQVQSVERQARGGFVDVRLCLEPMDAMGSSIASEGEVEMRFRIPLPQQALRDLARLGLLANTSDQGELPGRDPASSEKIRLCCPQCDWKVEVRRSMPQRHRPRCPEHNLATKC
jgi:hypothetical protein